MPFLLDVIRSIHVSVFRPHRAARLMIAAGLVLVIFSTIAFVSTARAESSAGSLGKPFIQDAAGGKAIFDEKCAGCHSIGGGKLVGPDLQDVASRRDIQWIKDFIIDPPKMLASDPIAQQILKENNNVPMPVMGLTADQVDAVVEYLRDPAVVPAAPAAPSLPAGAGDPLAGQRLFTGEMALANGGTSCIACHSVNGAGSLGGGALGPDLTHVVQRLGEPGLSAALKTIAFPTMLGPFQNRPLSAKEQADLVAFLKDADRLQAPVPVAAAGALTPKALLVFALGLLGGGLLFGLLLVIWARLKKRHSPHLPIRRV